ncbi:MAG TPA: dihydrodipicolinate synthase family protein, partial [Chitinophagaceae bacterium]|nr:dihydrodipicolinate synthase family protein [Chitinophagaceae bacterium]
METAVKKLLHEGTVIPAHPLALDEQLQLDEYNQRRLTRYYLDCGAGGVAVGVHTTQFAIRRPGIDLLETVLRLAAEEIASAKLGRPVIKVAGICGNTDQALREAGLAVKYGYDLGLVSLGGLKDYSEEELIAHIRSIAGILPVFGFYLQPAVGGRLLGYSFWKEMAE